MTSRRLLVVLALLTIVGLWSLPSALEEPFGNEGNYSQIEPGLYMGGAVSRPPHGTSAVLNLCRFPDQYSAAHALWEPIRDAAPAPSLDWLSRMVRFVDEQRTAKRTTFVHCRNGASRSGMVVVAYMMFKHGWKRDEAVDFVRSKRPQTRPNPVFMVRLGEWETLLAAK